MSMRSKPKTITPFSVREQTKSYFYKNRNILGLIITNYLLFFIYMIAYLISFASITTFVTSFITGYTFNSLEGLAFMSITNVIILVLVGLITYMFKTLIYQVLLDFIRNPEKYSNYSFLNFIIEPFKKISIMSAIYIFILNLIKYIVISVVNGLLLLVYSSLTYVLLKTSLSVLLVLGIFFPILSFIINIKLYLTFSQINVAIADYQLSNKSKNIFDVFSIAYRMMENQCSNYLFLMISYLKWFVILGAIILFSSAYIVGAASSYIIIASVVIGIILIHFYIPYIALAQVTFYDEVLQIRNLKI